MFEFLFGKSSDINASTNKIDVEIKNKMQNILKKPCKEITYEDLRYLMKHKLLNPSTAHHAFWIFESAFKKKLPKAPHEIYRLYDLYHPKKKYVILLRMAVSSKNRHTIYLVKENQKAILHVDKQM
jgi:hypothetical protein